MLQWDLQLLRVNSAKNKQTKKLRLRRVEPAKLLDAKKEEEEEEASMRLQSLLATEPNQKICRFI
jgi:hypothetical protein